MPKYLKSISFTEPDGQQQQVALVTPDELSRANRSLSEQLEAAVATIMEGINLLDKFVNGNYHDVTSYGSYTPMRRILDDTYNVVNRMSIPSSQSISQPILETIARYDTLKDLGLDYTEAMQLAQDAAKTEACVAYIKAGFTRDEAMSLGGSYKTDDQIKGVLEFTDLGYTVSDFMTIRSYASYVNAYQASLTKLFAEEWESNRKDTGTAITANHTARGIKFAPKLNLSGVKNITNLFADCNSLTYVPELVAPDATKADTVFKGCSSLNSVGVLQLNSMRTVGSYSYPFFEKAISLTRFEARAATSVALFSLDGGYVCIGHRARNGYSYPFVSQDGGGVFVDTPAAAAIYRDMSLRGTGKWVTNCIDASNFREIYPITNLKAGVFLNIGKNASSKTFDFSQMTYWPGIWIDSTSGATDSCEVRMTVGEMAYDRAANDLPPATIKLSEAQYRYLRDEDIAIANAKGFTITT